MKLSKFARLSAFFSLLLSTNLYAQGSYFPPERLYCNLDVAGKVECQGIDNDYLTPAQSMGVRKDGDVFFFVSGEATLSADRKEALIMFTYKTPTSKVVKLAGASSAVMPNLSTRGNWIENKDHTLTCTAYMRCPLTK